MSLSGTGAAGSPACVGTSPWHLHWHRPESGAGRVDSPPAAPSYRPQTGPQKHAERPTRRWPRAWPLEWSLQRAAAPALCGERPWRGAARGGRSVGVQRQSGGAPPVWQRGGGRTGSFRRAHTIFQKKKKREKTTETREVGGHLRVDSHCPCPLCGHAGHAASLSTERGRNDAKSRLKVSQIGIHCPSRYFSGWHQVLGTSAAALTAPATRVALELLSQSPSAGLRTDRRALFSLCRLQCAASSGCARLCAAACVGVRLCAALWLPQWEKTQVQVRT